MRFGSVFWPFRPPPPFFVAYASRLPRAPRYGLPTLPGAGRTPSNPKTEPKNPKKPNLTTPKKPNLKTPTESKKSDQKPKKRGFRGFLAAAAGRNFRRPPGGTDEGEKKQDLSTDTNHHTRPGMGIGYRAFFGGRLQTADTIARETTPRDGRRGGKSRV